jgi:hypothetical protein
MTPSGQLSAGSVTGTVVGVKVEAATRFARAVLSLLAEARALSTARLREELLPQLWANPVVVLDEQTGNRGVSRRDPEEDEIPPEEWIDEVPADIVETGEGNRDDREIPEYGENPFLSAGRRLREDFASEDDAEVRGIIRELLEKWQRREWDPGMNDWAELPRDIRRDVACWFKQLLKEHPQLDEVAPLSGAGEPDIIFHVNETSNGTEIYPEINLGFLGRCRLNPPAGDVNRMTFRIGKSGFSANQLMDLIEVRKAGLTLLAHFLIEKQAAFLKAPDAVAALSRLRSYRQAEFAEFIRELIPEKKSKRHPKKDASTSAPSRENPKRFEDQASRIIKDTYVRLPFDSASVPAKFFFDEFIGRVNVLRAAIELGRERKYPKLLATDQELILYLLCRKESFNENNIRKKLWPILQEGFLGRKLGDSSLEELKEAGRRLGIVGTAGRISPSEIISNTDMADLINVIRDELGLEGQTLTESDIDQAREELKRLKASKRKPQEGKASKE